MTLEQNDTEGFLEQLLEELEKWKLEQVDLTKVATTNKEWVAEMEEELKNASTSKEKALFMEGLEDAHKIRVAIEANQLRLDKSVKSVKDTIKKLRDQLN